jgi:hypothetical protein
MRQRVALPPDAHEILERGGRFIWGFSFTEVRASIDHPRREHQHGMLPISLLVDS